RCWVQVDGFDPVYAIADEDSERENAEKTSAVHFLRFELTSAMTTAAKLSATINMGVDHPSYRHRLAPLPQAMRDALVKDFC
ncbi:MAG: DUF3501 family protein, partial [Candidatus Obscuribacterales bacterium]|nr:DUF3501 family protein [Steroidobacteraceae bacterium]